MELSSSWILVRFVSAEPQRELQELPVLIKLSLQTLRFELHVNFQVSQILLLIFFQPFFKNIRPILFSQARKKRGRSNQTCRL